MRHRIGLTLTAVLVLALALVGGPSEAAGETTREAYVEAAESICKRNTNQNKRVLKGIRKQIARGKLRRAAQRIKRAARLLDRALDQLDALEKPSADQATLERWLARHHEQVPLLKQLAKLVRRDRLNRAQRIRIELNLNDRRANEVVVGFGFRSCAVKPGRFA